MKMQLVEESWSVQAEHQGWSSELGEVAAKLASQLPPRPPARRKGLRVDGKQEINLEWPYGTECTNINGTRTHALLL